MKDRAPPRRAGAAAEADATLVVTSCRRPALLDATLASIAAADLSAVAEVIVIEDSGTPSVAGIVAARLGAVPHRFLQNPRNLGQLASVDRAYAEVRTPYVYHCEDDYLFPSGLFLPEARAILAAEPAVLSVMVRKESDSVPPKGLLPLRDEVRQVEVPGRGPAAYRLTDPTAIRRWGGFTFQPGLRRMADYRDHGPYAAIGPERVISFEMKLRGRVLAQLMEADAEHVGAVTTPKPDERRRVRSRGFLAASARDRVRWAWFRARHAVGRPPTHRPG